MPVDKLIDKIIEMYSIKQTDEEALGAAIKGAIAQYSGVVASYRSGKTNAIMVLVGVVMREMGGKADAQQVRDALVLKLK